MRLRAILIPVLFCMMPLAACGFHPLYGGVAGDIRRLELGQIAVTPIETRIGNDLRNVLIDRLTDGAEPKFPQYRLDIGLSEVREGLAIQEDASVTRVNYQLVSTYELFDLGEGRVIHKGVARSIAAYNVVDSQFATLSAERDAAERASRDLANSIEIRLALFFEQRRR